MWVRKTLEDIAYERRKLLTAFGWPVVFALIMSAGFIVKCWAERGRLLLGPTTLNQLLVEATMLGSVVAVVGYLVQMKYGRPFSDLMLWGSSKVLICSRCFQMKTSDRQPLCDCGGTFEDFSLWKWVDDAGTPQGDDAVHRTDGIEPGVIVWKTRTAGFCVGNPRVRGIWNSAILIRGSDNTLRLEGKYDPPGSAMLALITTAIAIAIAAVLNAPPYYIGFIAGCFVCLYGAILFWRKRRVVINLEGAFDAVVDQRRKRIGFFLPFDYQPRWIVVEFAESFADAEDVVRDIMGVKCKAGTIGGGSVVPVIVLAVLLFVLAFGYFMAKAMLA